MKHIRNIFDLYLLYFLESLCFFNIHDYSYTKQKVKGFDSFGKEHQHTMDVRICNKCKKRQALFSSPYGDRYETINREEL